VYAQNQLGNYLDGNPSVQVDTSNRTLSSYNMTNDGASTTFGEEIVLIFLYQSTLMLSSNKINTIM
jgi:hypothetical protein